MTDTQKFETFFLLARILTSFGIGLICGLAGFRASGWIGRKFSSRPMRASVIAHRVEDFNSVDYPSLDLCQEQRRLVHAVNEVINRPCCADPHEEAFTLVLVEQAVRFVNVVLSEHPDCFRGEVLLRDGD